MNNTPIEFQQALQWAIQYLTADASIVSHQEIVQTSYSVVHKIQTSKQTVYLKQTPEALFLEPKTLTFLHEQGCKNIPELLADNLSLRCFIMTPCGDESLRHRFKGKIDFKMVQLGIENYTKIQRLLEDKIPQQLALGLPDWRLDKFPLLYYQLIQQTELLIGDGLTQKEIDDLHRLHPICVELCEALAAYKIPETINHCDFHENNMLFDEKSKKINIIDWGEAVVSHPFLSLNGCLWNLTYFNKLKETDLMYAKLQAACTSAWLDIYDEKKLLKILTIANRLLGIFAALSYERLYVATQNQSETVQQEHHGSIAGCLRTFLNPMLSYLSK